MEGVFIIGTDTSVGKTMVSAGLLQLLQGTRKVAYWKPIQTGTIVSDDTKEIKNLTGFGPGSFVDPGYRFPDPLSPHVAAQKWGKSIDLHVLTETFRKEKADGKFLIVEGAGGLLVPLNDYQLQIDLIRALGLPLIVVGEDRVGVINQMLLTVNECREQNLQVLGCVLSNSRGSFGNAEAITRFGKIEVLAELKPTQDPKNLLAEVGGNRRLREIFNIGKLPG